MHGDRTLPQCRVEVRQNESAEESADFFERGGIAPWVQSADKCIPQDVVLIVLWQLAQRTDRYLLFALHPLS
jgi:hypothetical protein